MPISLSISLSTSVAYQIHGLIIAILIQGGIEVNGVEFLIKRHFLKIVGRVYDISRKFSPWFASRLSSGTSHSWSSVCPTMVSVHTMRVRIRFGIRVRRRE